MAYQETARETFFREAGHIRHKKKIERNYSVGLCRVCPSEARVLAALTVRKRGIASKNPLPQAILNGFLAVNLHAPAADAPPYDDSLAAHLESLNLCRLFGGGTFIVTVKELNSYDRT